MLYRVLLNWEDHAIAELSFSVEQDTVPTSGGFRVMATTNPNTNAYEHLFFLDASTTPAATIFIYRIRGLYSMGSSTVTNTATVTTRP